METTKPRNTRVIALESVPARPTANSSVLTILRDRIKSGEYKHGERLPTERALAEELNAHRINVRYALARLEGEGLLLRQPHCRPVVQTIARDTPGDDAAPGPPPRADIPTSRSVALIMWHGDILDESPTAQQTIFWGVMQALGQFGYHAVFLNLGETDGSEDQKGERESAHLRYVLEHNFAGAIFFPHAYHSNHDLIREVANKVPLVLVDRAVPAPQGIHADLVCSANYQATYEATRHLISLGHTRIAYVSTAEAISPVQDRMRGYLRAIADADPRLSFETILTIPSRVNTVWSSFNAMFQVPVGERPTAVICVNDHTAVYVARHLSALGIQIPDDVSLIGFDDGVRTLPGGVGLSSIAQPFNEIGRTAAELFVRRIKNPGATARSVELPTHLVLRESVGPPPAGMS